MYRQHRPKKVGEIAPEGLACFRTVSSLVDLSVNLSRYAIKVLCQFERAYVGALSRCACRPSEESRLATVFAARVAAFLAAQGS